MDLKFRTGINSFIYIKNFLLSFLFVFTVSASAGNIRDGVTNTHHLRLSNPLPTDKHFFCLDKYKWFQQESLLSFGTLRSKFNFVKPIEAVNSFLPTVEDITPPDTAILRLIKNEIAEKNVRIPQLNSSCPIVLNDITVCPNTDGQLKASGASFYEWSPATGLSNPSIANPIVNIPNTQTYTVTAYTEIGDNLIKNGDFSLKDETTFSSVYKYVKWASSTALWPEGYFAIGPNPKSYHMNFSTCGDHTTGTGNMMIVNGNRTANAQVWGQTITVQPNKFYAFYAYVTAVHPDNPPILQFSINGKLLGVPFEASTTTCSWQKFYSVWYSGSSTSANISIVNQNVEPSGNDFALDDIKYVELCITQQDVTVHVSKPTSTTNLSICPSEFPYKWNGLNCPTPGTYTATLKSSLGCDSVATLVLTSKQGSTSTTNVSICSTQFPYRWNGTDYPTAGTFTKVFPNSVGCDSVATLVLSERLVSTSTTKLNVCSDDFPYVWNGTSLIGPGTYSKTFSNAVGCDSIATLILTEVFKTSSTTAVAVCPTDFPYTWNGTQYHNPGTYYKKFVNSVGCDSTATLVLSKIHNSSSLTHISLCSNQYPYNWNGTEYSTPGTYQQTFVNSLGCDSLATLVLSLSDNIVTTTRIGLCPNEFPYKWNGVDYPLPGTYTQKFIAAGGCDSTSTIILVQNNPTSSTTKVTLCAKQFPYRWNGKNYNRPGTYTTTLVNSMSCDSVATLELSEYMVATSTTEVTICSGYFPYKWNGVAYPRPGTYTANLFTAAGCDSVATLILNELLATSSTTEVTVCPGNYPYRWNGNTYTTAGTYTKTFVNKKGCDSIATLILKDAVAASSITDVSVCADKFPYVWNGKSYPIPGTFSQKFISAVGCDSIATLVLKRVMPTASTTTLSLCPSDFPYSWNGIDYTAAGTYSKNFTNVAGCDSVATLIIKAVLPTSSTTQVYVCPGQYPYSWNGNSYPVAGTYTVMLKNVSGCDSIATLDLKDNTQLTSITKVAVCSSAFPFRWNGIDYAAAGTYTYNTLSVFGCDSVATLELTEKLATTSTTNLSICSGELPYMWNGIVCDFTGTYTKKLINAAGCDSTLVLNLTVLNTIYNTVDLELCPNEKTYNWQGTIVACPGVYTQTFSSSAWCDSIVTLRLSVKNSITNTVQVSLCANEFPYDWAYTSYPNPGTYTKTFISDGGCDSIVTLILTRLEPTSSTKNVSLCPDDFPYRWNGRDYTAAGTYTKKFTNKVGCDSTAILHITALHTTSSTKTVTLCTSDFPYFWNDTEFTTSGVYTKTFVNSQGCDSVATLTLIELKSTKAFIDTTVCDTYIDPKGREIKSSGTFWYVMTNSNGCDSIVTVYLTVNHSQQSSLKISACDRYTAPDGKEYSASGNYRIILQTVSGCDSIVDLNLTIRPSSTSHRDITLCSSELPLLWNGISCDTTGLYTARLTNSVGCDSIATLSLTVNESSYSSSNVDVCSHDLPYVWNKNKYYKDGIYSTVFTNKNGCDSVAKLLLKILQPSSSLTKKTLPPSELPFVWNKVSYYETGDYVAPYVFVNCVGCDSIAKLMLRVGLDKDAIQNVNVCETELPYTWNGQQYYAEGTYTRSFMNTDGIVITLQLNLKVGKPQTFTQDYTLLYGEKFRVGKNVYTEDGTYTDVLKAVGGCDSTVITNLRFIKIPNTFTPDGDGINDMFMEDFKVKIYNRNGILLFEGDRGWNGTSKGRKLQKDTYFYVLYYKSGDTTKTKEGYIMLAR